MSDIASSCPKRDLYGRRHAHVPSRGERVRLLGGTDDYSLKNVLAAEAAGVPTDEFVANHATCFAALAEPLGLAFDEFIHTSADSRHRPAVERLWRACAAAGDLYRADYEGRSCVGCEEFYAPTDLVGDRCPEHGTSPEVLVERNWFFRLSRYANALTDAIESGAWKSHRPFTAMRYLPSYVGASPTSASPARSREPAAEPGPRRNRAVARRQGPLPRRRTRCLACSAPSNRRSDRRRADALTPIVPQLAAALTAQLTPISQRPPPRPVIRRLATHSS